MIAPERSRRPALSHRESVLVASVPVMPADAAEKTGGKQADNRRKTGRISCSSPVFPTPVSFRINGLTAILTCKSPQRRSGIEAGDERSCEE